jgi:DNA repair photolyase
MSMITERATASEKCEAWERMMRSTATKTDDALMEAYEWLSATIEKREAAVASLSAEGQQLYAQLQV